MTATFNQIDWDTSNIFRLVTVFVQALLLMEMVLMLAHYWWRVIPLRKQVGVVSPPIRWTFVYHILVALIVGSLWISNIQRLAFEESPKPTLSTYTNPVLAFALWVAVRQFVKYYSRDLSRAEWSTASAGSDRPACPPGSPTKD